MFSCAHHSATVAVPWRPTKAYICDSIDHISVALKGRITIIDQDGTKVDVTGPDAFVTRAGTQRVVYVHEDITFMTIHPCLEKDNDKVTDVLGCKTMGEYNSMKLLEN